MKNYQQNITSANVDVGLQKLVKKNKGCWILVVGYFGVKTDELGPCVITRVCMHHHIIGRMCRIFGLVMHVARSMAVPICTRPRRRWRHES